MSCVKDPEHHQSNAEQTAQNEYLFGIGTIEIKTEQKISLEVFHSVINLGMKMKQPTITAAIAAISTAPAAISLTNFI